VAVKSCRLLMIYPRFAAPSFWNYHDVCKVLGARYPTAPLSLITVAALLPPSWDVRLLDRNAEELTPADLDRADLVMTGGMMAQKTDTLDIIRICREQGKPVVVGGCDVTSSPHLYAEADFQVRGEAEGMMETFVEAWTAGERKGVFTSEKFTVDITQSPTPRFDLLNFSHYLYPGVQFSRGCPFTCEFCDIIELYGRVPRTKTNDQMLAELDALYRLGYRGFVDFVNDNFIGNKKAIKRFLPALVNWQKERGYPFEFSTEATINLADDDELLDLMRGANFFMIFVGIESPNTETLIAMQKKQNTRRSLSASVNKIYKSGIVVKAGFIVGFDSEKLSVANEMIDCIESTSIPNCMVGLLAALPTTQLTRRLAREGRLHSGYDNQGEAGGDQGITGLNFETLRPRRDVYLDYATILEKIYDREAYFKRVRRMGRLIDRSNRAMSLSMRELLMVARLIWHMQVKQKGIRGSFWNTVLDCAIHNPRALKYVMITMALYLHIGPFSRYVRAHTEEQIALIDTGEQMETRLALPPVPSMRGSGGMLATKAG
jgi:radical SAM superfamily enzyme YgiQ (UPF0313 family)